MPHLSPWQSAVSRHKLESCFGDLRMPANDALKSRPFADFLGRRSGGTPLRAGIDAAHRLPEPDCVPPLIVEATLPDNVAAAVRALTIKTVTAMRAQKRRGGV